MSSQPAFDADTHVRHQDMQRTCREHAFQRTTSAGPNHNLCFPQLGFWSEADGEENSFLTGGIEANLQKEEEKGGNKYIVRII